MALGTRTQGTLIILKPKTKEESNPHFSVIRKEDGKWGETGETVNQVSGDLTKVEVKEDEYEGRKYKVINVFLQDKEAGETYLLDLRLNMITKSLFNALSNLTDPRNISISLYKNKKSHNPNFGVWQNDELVRWKYSLEELPEPEEVTFKGETMKDYSKSDEMVLSSLLEMAEAVLNRDGDNDTESSDKEEDSDDIPF